MNAPLRDNVRLLGDLLGECLRQQAGEAMFDTIERIRQASVATRGDAGASLDSLRELLSPLDDDTLLDVARAFSQFLNLSNIAEQRHRERLHRQHQRFPGDPGGDQGMRDVLERLQAEQIPREQISDTLKDLSVELVLTAHPTEVTRRTLIRKYDHMADLLSELDRPDLTDDERQFRREKLRRVILAAWTTDEIRRERPTPVDEAKWGFATIEQSLWYALPEMVRQLEAELVSQGLPVPPPDWAPVRLASWMGGDRDGNPNVTAEVTREVLLLARWMAADLYLRDVENLLADLSMSAASEELLTVTGPSHEPYRVVLRQVRERLRLTREQMEARVEGLPVPEGEAYLHRDELLAPLRLIDRSLRDVGLADIADGDLKNTLRRLNGFGITLLRLDIRQESTRHADAIDAITRYLQLGSYNDWDEDRKQAFLVEELQARRPLIDASFADSEECSADVAEVLATCRVIAEQGSEGLGAYVISMARAPSDVLAVMLLQKIAGVTEPMRVVPLFETLDDLDRAEATMQALMALPFYRERVADGQEVMIGYSDSAKDAGFLGAAWAQYRAQEKLTALFAEHGIPLTLFHGRGGSISRGGSPTRMALLSQPPGSVAGRIRVTEQGEVIRFKYGRPAVAVFNLAQYVAATLETTLLPPRAALPQWREQMQTLTDVSVDGYRSVVRDEPELVR
ncbi:MAG: phosphoenolpyruvate carboxylase, partial [Pseudomonadales bacterium]|nr:phosphoenolpyruvate carboxylase [Pseudomonadales bacterium]